MNFLKKKKARAQRAPTKKKGSFSAETRFFLLGNTKDLAAEGCSVSVSLLSIFTDSCVFFCWSLDDRLLKIWPRAWKTWHRMQATDSHRQPYAATGSHKPRKIIKSGLLMGPGCQDAAPKPIHLKPHVAQEAGQGVAAVPLGAHCHSILLTHGPWLTRCSP